MRQLTVCKVIVAILFDLLSNMVFINSVYAINALPFHEFSNNFSQLYKITRNARRSHNRLISTSAKNETLKRVK